VKARTIADALRAVLDDQPKLAPVGLDSGVAQAVQAHLARLADLEDKGEDLLVEAFQKELNGPQSYDGSAFAAEPMDADGMEGRGIYLEGTYDLAPVLRHILGAGE
jgi:hypothetical protein